ncbi:MAG: AAA family ATPase [Candidatus Poribacteria bacterium]|nr:AAA family ATPase [Candidatus Poribacteria bacterium]
MTCPRCDFESPPGAKFCMECGTRLANRCPKCGTTPPVEAKFCPACGTKFPVSQPQTQAHETPDAERRQLTVMFCDLVGSTPLAEQLDPEELREVLRAYQAVCARVSRRFDGYIARYFGDGILVYYGYPVAHEDDAQRALHAGLGILEEIKRLKTPLQWDIRLQVRLGIHTGLVVAGDMDEGARLESMAIVGETPNIAARLQGLAEPNTLIISAATYRLIEGFFDCRALGVQSLRGITQPMPVYQVLRESTAKSRLDVVATTGLTPLVGREQEVGLLLERWEMVKEGMGQTVLLRGEAGIGKSRLARVLKEHAAQEAQAWLIECRCSPYYQNSALYPVIDLLQRVMLSFEREDSSQEKLSKLEAFLRQSGFALEEMVPLFAALLSIPMPDDRYPDLTLTPQSRKQKTLEALLEVLLLEPAVQRPVLLIVEDLHWADPSTLELLDLIINQEPTARIFTLLTFRSDFSPPWTIRSYMTPITLNRLTRKQVAIMVDRMTEDKALPAEVLKQVVARTDGNPLFVEELTKMVLESGMLRKQGNHYELTGPLPPLVVPATLQDLLMARLDQLSTAKEVAQLSATLGREFSYELLAAVSPLEETILQQELAQLVDAEVLDLRHHTGSGMTYSFKHILIQEAAYQSLLKSTRQQYHQQIAFVLVDQFPEIVETQPELLAHHCTTAGLHREAIFYRQRAGERAIERSANVEAIRHITKGLELFQMLPDTPERAQQELILRTTLGPALIATKGYAAPEVEDTYTRARELCRQSGEAPQLFPVLFGLWLFYLVRADLRTARELGEQLLRLAQSVKDRAFLVEAHRVLGATLYYLGELEAARSHLEKGIALYDSQQHRSHAFLYYLADPGMTCLAYTASVLWCLGYPDQALRRIQEALTLAQELSHPFSTAVARHFAGLVHQCRREPKILQGQAESEFAVATEQGFPLWVAGGTFLRGWALTAQGQENDGIAQMRQGLDAWRATGAGMLSPYFLALLAEAYGKVGQPERGWTVLAEAIAAMETTDERSHEPELHRLKGELLLTLSTENQAEAEVCFRQALDTARRQHARSWELRAAMSLSRLWQQRGKKEDARQLLAGIYGWFTEGFDTADLKAAEAQLEELT